MSFAHPQALLLLLLLVPVGLLYWLRLRVPRVVVGTGLFWQRALAEEPVRAAWQRWRTPISLVLHALTVILLALAASGPEIQPPQRIVLILDNSATMRATDVLPSRLDAAKEAARRMIDGLRPCDEMAVVAIGPSLREKQHELVELQPPTSDKTLLNAAVDALSGEDRTAPIEPAVKLARMIPMSGKAQSRVVLITDGCSREATRNAQESGVEIVRIGTAAGNLAITSFTARRIKEDPTKCEVFVDVRNRSSQTVNGSVTISVRGPCREVRAAIIADARAKIGLPPGIPLNFDPLANVPGETEELQPRVRSDFTVAKDGDWQHVFTLALPTAARLIADVKPADAYPFDNIAVLDMPPPPTVERRKSDPIAAELAEADERSLWNYRVICPTLVVGLSYTGYGPPRETGSEPPWSAPYFARGGMEGPVQQVEHRSYMCRPGEAGGADIRVPLDIGSEESALMVQGPNQELWTAPAGVAVLLLVIEWCLNQRRWTS